MLVQWRRHRIHIWAEADDDGHMAQTACILLSPEDRSRLLRSLKIAKACAAGQNPPSLGGKAIRPRRNGVWEQQSFFFDDQERLSLRT